MCACTAILSVTHHHETGEAAGHAFLFIANRRTRQLNLDMAATHDYIVVLEDWRPVSPGTFSSDLLLTSDVQMRPQPQFYDPPLRRTLMSKYFLAGYFIYV